MAIVKILICISRKLIKLHHSSEKVSGRHNKGLQNQTLYWHHRITESQNGYGWKGPLKI